MSTRAKDSSASPIPLTKERICRLCRFDFIFAAVPILDYQVSPKGRTSTLNDQAPRG